MAEQPRHSVSVAAVVSRDDGRVLCIRRRDNGHWEPPGGVLEIGERIHAGLVREVQEETGLLIVPDELTGVYQNEPRNIIALVFAAKVSAGNLRTSDESAEVDWLTPGEVNDRMDPAYAIRFLDALNFNGAASIRVHDGIDLT